MILLRHGQSEFNLHFTATRRDPGIKDAALTKLGCEQAEAAARALAGEPIRRIIVSPRTELALAWPEVDFSHIEEVWWPAMPEPADQVVARANRFRGEMAALPDWADTLVVTHWGFIMSLTGRSVPNGEWMRFDPTLPAPSVIPWRP